MAAHRAPFAEFQSPADHIAPMEFSLARAARLNPTFPRRLLGFLLWN